MNKIILINDYKIDQNLIEKVLEISELPDGRILLIFSDGYLLNGLLGCCIPRPLVKYETSIGVFNPYLNENWDCVVALSKKACDYRSTHEAYFVYLLAHEFGHAHIGINDIATHIFSCIIQSHIREASNNKITQWHELPHEKLFDQFGLLISGSILSNDHVYSQIKSLTEIPECKDKERLEAMLSLPPFEGFDSLRNQLISFALPYKVELIRLWKEERSDLSKTNTSSILELINDFDEMFIKLKNSHRDRDAHH